MLTKEQIADIALRASFFVTPGGQWLRMDFCDLGEGYFEAHSEDDGEEYRFTFEELVLGDTVPQFYELVPIAVDKHAE